MPRRTFIKVAIVIAAVALWLATRSHMPTSTESDLQYAGRPLAEFHCAPSGPGPHPAVVMLHGAALRGTADQQFHSMCAALAGHGYYGEFLEYYDATDNTDSTTDQTEDFNAWFAAIQASIEALAKNSAVDPKRIAVMGFSQGAYLATGCGAMFPHQVAAVIEYYGGLIPPLRERARQMPPTLILHGAKDAIIPVTEATGLDQLLTSYDRPHEIHLYPDAGHGFNFHGEGVRYDHDAATDAWTRSLDFLDRTLRNPGN